MSEYVLLTFVIVFASSAAACMVVAAMAVVYTVKYRHLEQEVQRLREELSEKSREIEALRRTIVEINKAYRPVPAPAPTLDNPF